MKRNRDLSWGASRGGWLAQSVVVLGLLLPSLTQRAAAAPRKRVAVLALESDVLIDAVARTLRTVVSDAIAARPDWELEETQVSLAQLSLAHDCSPSEPACLRSIARQLQLDTLVFGRMSHNGAEIVVRLSRFDPQKGRVERTADATFMRSSLTAEGLAWQGRALASELFDAGALRLESRAQGSSPMADPRGTPQPSAAAPSGISARSVAGYGSLAAAAVATGLSVFSFVQIGRAQDDPGFAAYRRAVGSMQPTVRDVCAEAQSGASYGLGASDVESAKSSCSRGNTYQLLQFVFLGSALVTGGLGAFLLLGDSSERTTAHARVMPALTVKPNFWRKGAELRAKWSF